MIKGIGVTKTFDTKKALDNITFDIADGSVYGLVGSNGSGKSTLLRLLSGVFTPDSGKMLVDGVNIYERPDLKSQIIFLGDTPYFFPQSNLNEMAKFYASVYPEFSTDEYNRLLSVFPLDPKARLSSFSKGMQRQASLILALASKPRYMLMDESFDGLDVVMRKVLINLIMEGVENRNMTAIIASHNLRELEDMCDHIGIIHNGNLVMNGEIESLKDTVHKVQVAFKNVPEMAVFDELDVLKTERSGSLLQLVVRGEKDKIMSFINKLNPIFAECIEPTLEEMFVFELEVTGYDVKNILE